MDGNASFGLWLKQRRKALRLTQDEVAQHVGCAVVTIRKIEADERRPSEQIAARLADLLAIAPDDRVAFVKAARAELAVDRLAPPIYPSIALLAERGLDRPRHGLLKGYELREPIGTGGFGAVYRAYQPLVGREVAIKVIRPEYANHLGFIRRFEAEAQIVARLEHPHIVPLYDYWRESGGAYLVMRYIRGGNLRAALEDGPMALDASARLLDQIGAALASAHRQGVVHRDLKPANILLDEEGNAYLADFGIAKDLLLASAMAETQPGVVVRSPAYLSPEQLRDEPVTPCSDIYSLGVLLYEVLTGAHPFANLPPAEQLSRLLHEPLPPLQASRSGLPTVLNDVIQRATAKQPVDRYSDVLSMVVDWQQSMVSHLEGTRLSVVSSQPTTHDGQYTAVDQQPATDHGPRTTDAITLTDLVVVQNPYKGLRAFGEADAADFFGRETLTQRLLERLAEGGELARFLAVVGPSGSGKSSVVRAGLLPALRRGALPGSEHWFVVELLPGAYPLEELEAALLRIAVNPPASLLEQLQADERGLLRAIKRVVPADDEIELVLVIDQFEELFTLVDDAAVRAHVLNSLRIAATDPRSRARVIITLRADFTDHPLHYVSFGELLRQRTEFVLPLTPDELERAITRPAAGVGMTVEADLIATIVQDVSDQPGALPLLQYALTELFEQREGRTLTLQAYHTSGGVLGSLARRPDDLYASLKAEQQEAARQLFLRLITLGEGTEDTRCRVRRSELESVLSRPLPIATNDGQSAMDRVIDLYGRYRLLTFDRDPITREPTVEVAHEALIRSWGRLQAWLDASRDDLRVQRRLMAAAAEWANAGQDPSFLATGARLAQFEALAATTNLALNQAEQAYLHASLGERDRQRAQEQARMAREAGLERHSRTILRSLVVVLLLATLGAFALTRVALNQREAAQTQAALAQHNAADAQSLALISAAQVAASQGDPDLALALALIANRLAQPAPQTQRILADLAYWQGIWHRLGRRMDVVTRVAFSPDGKSALSGSDDNSLILWDIATGHIIRRFVGNISPVTGVAFSPDGRTALSSSYRTNELILWDMATGQAIHRFGDLTSPAFAYMQVFGPDGRTALSASSDGTITLWDVATRQAIRQFKGHTAAVNAVAFSPDGRTALSSGSDQTLILWDVATGQAIRHFEGHTAAVNAVAFSPDGRTALSSGDDQTLILWDVATGQAIRHFEGHTAAVNAVAFSPDGRTALSSGDDQTLILWDVATHQILRRFTGHTSPVTTVVFGSDGRTALSGAADGTIILWGLYSGVDMRRFVGHTGGVTTVAFSPDGRSALSGSTDTTLISWDVATGQALRHLTGYTGAINAVAFSPNGTTALSGANDQTVVLWDVAAGKAIRRFSGHTGPVNTVAFSPDGKTALSGAADRALILWDLTTGQAIRRLAGHTGPVNTVVFSPNGTTALSGSSDQSLILWDVATGQVIRRFTGHTGGVTTVAFSPDSTTALSGSLDHMLILWDVATGQALRHFEGHTDAVLAAAFSPDGKIALTGSVDKSLHLWRIDTLDELIAWVHANRYVAELTCDQRALYHLEPLCSSASPSARP